MAGAADADEASRNRPPGIVRLTEMLGLATEWNNMTVPTEVSSISGIEEVPIRLRPKIRLMGFHQRRLWILSLQKSQSEDLRLTASLRRAELVALAFSVLWSALRATPGPSTNAPRER